jgi:hypothetical protein
VVAADAYDVTACAELTLSTGPTDDTRRVLVSADSSWRPSKSVEWQAPDEARRSFEALLASAAPDRAVRPNAVRPQCGDLERVRFFETPGHVDYAIGGTNAGYVLARKVGAGWSVVDAKSTRVTIPFGAVCYRPLAVFDMNGDGRPEIVLRESDGASWSEIVLSEDTGGAWRSVAESPGGATA